MTKVKSIEGWDEFADKTGNMDWCDYAKPRDEITEEVYDYFLDVLPPASLSYGYLQVGSANDHIRDDRGQIRATYTTFIKGEKKYFYCGSCFLNETVHREEI